MSKIPLYGTTHVKVRAHFLSILMKNKCNLGRILDGLLDLLSRGQYKGARNSFSGLKYRPEKPTKRIPRPLVF